LLLSVLDELLVVALDCPLLLLALGAAELGADEDGAWLLDDGN